MGEFEGLYLFTADFTLNPTDFAHHFTEIPRDIFAFSQPYASTMDAFFNVDKPSSRVPHQLFTIIEGESVIDLSVQTFFYQDERYINEEGIDERYLFKYTLPKAKLFYPEPFIASPSYIHSDLIYLSILHYWYWLWFIFLYLIALFFISFLITVRWCNTHRRPKRETQGVSRSKCGDLITACFPVSWAASIIISESTDAADLNDGFGTGEIVVGVRAYQWGWQYFYPRSIDLMYNVSNTNSSFVGNSLKYTHSSDFNSSSNHFWKEYQSKVQDTPLTPASVLLGTLAQNQNGSQNSLKHIGTKSLKMSSAFPRIRNNAKIYNTHLIHTTDSSISKSFEIANLYRSSNSTLDSASFGIRRPANLIAPISVINDEHTILDRAGFNRVLATNFTESSQLKPVNFDGTELTELAIPSQKSLSVV